MDHQVEEKSRTAVVPEEQQQYGSLSSIDYSTMINSKESLDWLDYVVIGLVLMVSASIGIYYRFTGGRQKTTAEYFSANRSMSIPLLAIALMVAFVSAIAMLGISGENYIYGGEFVLMNIGFFIATPITAYLYLPVFYNLQYMSVYEYLEKRFGKLARMTASVANYVQMSLYTGVVLFAPALALEATTGLSSTTSICLIGIICTFYSSIGGIKAVLATDVFQGFLMFASVFCVIAVGVYDFDADIGRVWRIATQGSRLNFTNFSLDPTVRHTWWSLIAGGMCFFLSNFAVNQVHVQRLLAARSLNSARLALFLNTPLITLMVVATSFSGLVLYAWFSQCDPVASGNISSFDQIMPYFAKVRMSRIPGLLGFFIAGVFSASLSTVSAMLNSLAAVAIADYIGPLYRKFGKELSDTRAPVYGKILAVVNGSLCIVIAFVASKLGNLIQTAVAINGALGGPVLGLFTLGLFFESANEPGVVFGTLASILLSMWIVFGKPKPPIEKLLVSLDSCPNMTHIDTLDYLHRQRSLYETEASKQYFYLYRISYMWYTPLGFTLTLILGIIASCLLRRCNKAHHVYTHPEPDLFTPIVAARVRRRRDDLAKTTTSQIFVLTPADADAAAVPTAGDANNYYRHKDIVVPT